MPARKRPIGRRRTPAGPPRPPGGEAEACPPPRSARPPKPPKSKPPTAGPSTDRHRRGDEQIFHGRRACEAILARRPEAIRRVYLDQPRSRQFRKLLEWCAAHRRGYQVVEAESLRRLTGSLHHEGIAILAAEVPRWTLADLEKAIAERRVEGPLLYLDGVSNPHNLGSILRTAAHFGVGCVMGRAGGLPPLAPATARVAEGAAEIVPVCDLHDPATDIGRLEQAGYRLVATASGRGESLHTGAMADRLVVAMGSEGQGVSPAILARAARTIRIPGTGAVESLNVAVACGVVLGEVWRRSRERE
jgi:TrmH RNA methyltransferase